MQIKRQIGTFKTQLNMHKRNWISIEVVYLGAEGGMAVKDVYVIASST